MAMASAAISSNSSQRRKGKRTSPLDSTDGGTFDNPLASPESTDARNDFTASGGELAEYGEGYDDKFSSSQIFQKLETEASVSPQPLPPPPSLPACPPHPPPAP